MYFGGPPLGCFFNARFPFAEDGLQTQLHAITVFYRMQAYKTQNLRLTMVDSSEKV